MVRTLPPLDLEHLAELAAEDGGLQRELVKLYLGEAAGLLADMRVALAAGRAGFWSWAANALKGSSGNVGAREVAALAAEAEAEEPSAEWLGWMAASLRAVRRFAEEWPAGGGTRAAPGRRIAR